MKSGRFTPRYLYIGGIGPVMETTGHDSVLPKLFSLIRIGGMTVKNRLAMAPIGTLYSSLEAPAEPALLKAMAKAARELTRAVHDHGVRIGVQLHKLRVTIRLGSKATAKTVQEESPDAVVVATGAVPSKPEVHEVEGMAREMYVIGDASRPRNGLFAIREGAELGKRI
jgi:2,4-dienoyl-CoA reductase-like NADH-dependent reductase (Old Yellow Enzyme family)